MSTDPPTTSRGAMAGLPGLVRPMLATLRAACPPIRTGTGGSSSGTGVRAVAYVSGRQVRLLSRNSKDMTARYPELAVLAGRVRAPVILDGEIVALRVGRPDFQVLQSRMQVRHPAARLINAIPCSSTCSTCCMPAVGRCWGCPTERRARLADLGLDADPVRTPPWYPGDGQIVLAASRSHGLEGVVGKPLASRYQPGRRRDWIKIKNTRHQGLLICG